MQVEVDLQTQKPSQILEQQTRDWVKSGGDLAQNSNDDWDDKLIYLSIYFQHHNINSSCLGTLWVQGVEYTCLSVTRGLDVSTVAELLASPQWPEVQRAITAGIEAANTKARVAQY